MGAVRTAVALLLMVSAAHARDDTREQARSSFERGKREFDAGRFRTALDAFQAAYALAPFPELLYNIARCQEELHRDADAIASYRRYVATTTSAIERDEIEQRITRLRESETRAATLTAQPPPAAPARPIYKRWWLWTAVGGAAAALAVGLGVGLTVGSTSGAHVFPPLVVK